MHKWEPDVYEKSSSTQQFWARELIPKLHLKGDEKVLDIGCGDGKITAEIASHLPRGQIVGLDCSSEMISFARSKYPIDDHPNLSFIQGNATKLEFKEEFDLVVSFACLHWIKDQLSVLRGIRESLKPSGRMLTQCGGRGNASEILDITEAMIREEKWSKYFEGHKFPYFFYHPDEYRPWLEQAGLKAMRVELLPKDMIHEGKPGLEGFIRSTWLPYTERVPESLRPEFISQIAEKYIDQNPLEDGKVHVKMIRLEVEAEKPI